VRSKPTGFDRPIYVTRPLLPPLDDYVGHLRDIWESQWLTNGGPKHQELERTLSQFFRGAQVSLFNNGTIALIVACQALRLSGEVITTPFTFPATPNVLSWNGITPVFADIDPVTMNLDPKNIERLITNRTSAILAVHVYGIPCDVEAIEQIAHVHGLRVVYDAAHAFATEVNGKPIVEFGDVSMLSFHATKLFHTAEGGALIVRDRELKDRIDLLKNFGIKNEFEVILPGINGKMSELQAAMGLAVLPLIAKEREARGGIARIYRERLATLRGFVVPELAATVTSSMQYFVIRIQQNAGRNRDQVYSALKEFGVHARKYFSPLCSEYSCYRLLPSSDPARLPVAYRVAEEVLCLPFYSGLSDDDTHRICDAIEYIVEA
jgi:dTDP-4-amino-4,6-dideoxygalactose transaminase